MSIWPASLPQTMEPGANDAPIAGFIRSPVATGPAKSRRRYTAVPRILSGTMFLDEAQKATFDTFYSTSIAEGSLSFSFIDPVDLSTITALFVEPPSFVALSGSATGVAQFRMNLVLEVLT